MASSSAIPTMLRAIDNSCIGRLDGRNSPKAEPTGPGPAPRRSSTLLASYYVKREFQLIFQLYRPSRRAHGLYAKVRLPQREFAIRAKTVFADHQLRVYHATARDAAQC